MPPQSRISTSADTLPAMNISTRTRATWALSFVIALGMSACGPDQENAAAAAEGSVPEILLPELGPAEFVPPAPAPPMPTGPAIAGERNLHFVWPIPCDLVVTEEHRTAAQVLLMEYRIELLPTVKEGEYLVRRRDFRILKVNGLDVTDAALRHSLVSLQIENGVMPDIRIDAQGQILDVEEWDTYFERLDALMKGFIADGIMRPESREEMLQQLSQPAVQQGVRMSGTNFWVLWINGWLDLDFSQTAEVTVPGEFPLADGSMLSFPQQIRHHGPEPNNPGYVYLSMESHLSGKEVEEAVIAKTGVERVPSFSRDRISKAEIVNTATVVLRPETMQPLEAWTENRVILETPDFNRDNIDLRRYRFEWK